MKASPWLLVAGLTVPIGACGNDLPACTDVDWVGENDHAQLTGAPSFSASQIVSGDPLFTLVPVDENTFSVRARATAVGDRGTVSFAVAETAGSETVSLPVEDTNLPVGVYMTADIVLNGESFDSGFYRTADPNMPYVLSITADLQSTKKCVTNIMAPTFAVVSE